MSTNIKAERRISDVRDDRARRLVHDAADPAPGQAGTTADTASQQVQDSMAQLVRQGLDTSLKSVQVWADLARQCGPTALASPLGTTLASRAHDPFEMLLAAQREVVGELVATQRQLSQQAFDASAGGPRAFR